MLNLLPAYGSVALLGLLAALLQTAALRQFLTVFAGNELVMGLALGVWLASAGAGSMAARRVTSAAGLAAAVLAAGLLAQLPSLLPLVRPFASLAPGETVPFGATAAAALLVLAPLCFAIGAQFPLAARLLKGDAPAAYGLEAAGAVLGGILYTFVLAGRASGAAVLAGAGAAYVAVAASLLRKPLALLLVAVPLLAPSGAELLTQRLGAPQPAAELRRESRYGAVEVYRSRGQADVYSAGKLQFSYPDRETEELRAHLPATLHPAPRRVLLVGGSPAVGRELLKYPGVTVDFVEPDPALIETAEALLDNADRAVLADGRWTAHSADGRRFIQQHAGGSYDLVILNIPEPATASINRYWTIEFFREVRRMLARGGLAVLTIPPAYGYLGTRMQASSGAVYQALARTFRHVAAATADYGLLIASDSAFEAGPEELRKRFAGRRIPTTSFHEYLFFDAFDPLNARAATARLAAVGTVNSDRQPIAFFHTLIVWADIHGSGFSALVEGFEERRSRMAAVLAAAGAAALLLFWRSDRAVAAAVFAGGFTAMSFSVVLLLLFQTSYGSVYERVGLFTATFMAGSATGALLLPPGRSALVRLRRIEGTAVAGLLLAAFLPPSAWPLYLLNCLSGVAAGALFAAAVRYHEEGRAASAAGMLYGLDLAGAFLGAVLAALVLVPLAGMRETILLLAALKAASLALLTVLPGGRS